MAQKKKITWISAKTCEKRFPGWLDSKGDAAWRLNGTPLLDPVDSRFGGFEVRVMLIDGQPDHAKGIYREAPNQNTVVWGYKTYPHEVLIGCTEEVRPFADDIHGKKRVQTFFQPCVMGFFDKLLGAQAKEPEHRVRLESGNEAAIREALEEMGVLREGIINLKPLGHIWPNATNTSSVTNLYEMQVDINKVMEDPAGREWTIKNCIWLSPQEVMRRIGRGRTGSVNCRMGQANSAFFTFQCSRVDYFLY